MASLSHSNMSISFYLLLLLLISIAFQPCYFQCLQIADDKFHKKLQAPIEGKMGKMVLSWDKEAIECMKLSPSKPFEERETVRSKRSKYKRRKKQLKRSVEELKRVSWKVLIDDDHKKVKGNNGVFSSDYEHARTHPPSHN